jgi:uncharacterized protein (TIGR03083 family)
MELHEYVEAWIESLRAIRSLDLDDTRGTHPTALPGWNVRDIVAHLVHIEEDLASERALPAETMSFQAQVSAEYTEAGVASLSHVPIAQLLDRLDVAAQRRRAQLDPLPPAHAPAARTPAGLQWTWDTLLRNRALDAWMHEQDIRRALDKPGNLDSLGARVTIGALAASLPFVIGKRAGVAPGHPVRFELTGPNVLTRTIEVDESGRAALTNGDTTPATVITMTSEAFARLAGGREPFDTFDIQVSGDGEVARRILANLAVTP